MIPGCAFCFDLNMMVPFQLSALLAIFCHRVISKSFPTKVSVHYWVQFTASRDTQHIQEADARLHLLYIMTS